MSVNVLEGDLRGVETGVGIAVDRSYLGGSDGRISGTTDTILNMNIGQNVWIIVLILPRMTRVEENQAREL